MAKITQLGLRIHGAENMRGNIIRFRTTTQARIDAVLEREIGGQADMMRQAFLLTYTEGSGRAGASIKGQAGHGTATISITSYREVKFLTRLLPESNFKGAPYVITPKKDRMVFYWRKAGRVVSLPFVTHPGFGQKGDVLADSGTIALSNLGWAVEREVRSAVAEISVGSQTFRVSGRRFRG